MTVQVSMPDTTAVKPTATVPPSDVKVQQVAQAGRAQSLQTDSAVEPELGRLKIRLNRARNLRGPELLSKKDCYVVFTFEKRRVASAVKFGTVAPVWDQDYYLDKVYYPPTSKVAITVVYKGDKKDEVLGVAAPGQHLWTKGTETPVDKWLPIATKDGIYAGELNFHLHWTKLEPEYRDVFKTLGNVVYGSRSLSRPFNSYIDKAVDGVFHLGSTVHQWFASLTTFQLYGLGIAAALLAFLLFLPGLLLMPFFILVTLALAVVFGPILLGLGWVVFTSAPVQDRLVKPLLDKSLKVDRIRLLLTKTAEA